MNRNEISYLQIYKLSKAYLSCMVTIDEENAGTFIFLIILVFTMITIWFYYKRDKYEPEPWYRIVIAFLLGLASIIPAAIFSLIMIFIMSTTSSFVTAVVVAPIVEELCKVIFVVQLAKHESFDGPLDGLIYGAMVGAGFAAGENLLYAFVQFGTSGVTSGITLAIIRSVSSVIGHPLYTGLAGAGIGEAKVGLSKNQYKQVYRSILLHAMWNGSASLPSYGMIIGLIIVIITSIILLRNEISIAVELDKQAFESGYYERKEQQKIEMMKRWRQPWIAPPSQFPPQQNPTTSLIEEEEPKDENDIQE